MSTAYGEHYFTSFPYGKTRVPISCIQAEKKHSKYLGVALAVHLWGTYNFNTWFNFANHMIDLAYLDVCSSLAASKLRHWTCRMNGSNFNVVVISSKSSTLRLFDDSLSLRIFQMASNSILSWEQINQLHPFFLFLFWTFWNEALLIFILYFELVSKL